MSKITTGKRTLSSDVYPLLNINGREVIKNTWLPCVETIALTAKKHNMDTHFFVQSAVFANYPEMTEADLRFQFLTEMAFGIRNFTYFIYNSFADQMVGMVSNSESLKTNPMYHSAKKVTAELNAIKNIYLSFDWLGTMPVFGTENESQANQNFNALKGSLTDISFIKNQSTSQDTLFGAFRDEDGNDGLIVSSFTHPNSGLFNKVSIEFQNAKKVAMYINGKEKIYNLKNNKLEVTLEAGQGAFLIPLA